jgi:hypothetical protein
MNTLPFESEVILNLAARNWRLFPVRARGKQPLINDWPGQATTDRGHLAAWAKRFPGCNWGVATGPESGIFVLDVDGEQGLAAVMEFQRSGRALPRTLTAQTGKGSHAYFCWPAGLDLRNSASKLAPSLDVRAAGGYVVVPPSVHPSGTPYEFVDEKVPVSPAPEWLLEQLLGRTHAEATIPTITGSIGKGQRNAKLATFAGAMRRAGMNAHEIDAALQEVNIGRCVPPLPRAEVSQIANSIGRYSPASSDGAVRRPELLPLSQVEAREVDWFWKPYLAKGMLAMLSGDPGAGKTFVALAIAAAATTGRVPHTQEPCEPGNVLYLSIENSAECVLRPRFNALGGDSARLNLLKGSITGTGKDAERGAVWLSDQQLLRAALEATKPALVVVDPIQSYLGKEVDAHRSNETRPVLDGLAHLAEAFRCCILLVRHLSKSQTGRAIHRGLGSIDLTGAVRTELLAGTAADGTQQRAIVQIKNNLGQFGESLGYGIEDGIFRWTGKSDLTAASLFAAEPGNDEASALGEAKEFLQEILQAEPRKEADVMAEARQAGISRSTLKRAKAQLSVKSRKNGMSGGWVWALCEEGQI